MKICSIFSVHFDHFHGHQLKPKDEVFFKTRIKSGSNQKPASTDAVLADHRRKQKQTSFPFPYTLEKTHLLPEDAFSCHGFTGKLKPTCFDQESQKKGKLDKEWAYLWLPCVNPKPTTQALETKAQSSTSLFNGNKSTDHVTPKGSLRTGHTAKEIQLSNRFETLGLCAVTSWAVLSFVSTWVHAFPI